MHEEYIARVFNECGVAALLGIEVIEVGEGSARGKLTIRQEHHNVFGDVHGGIIFAFLDHIAGACGNTLGKVAVLVESSIQYMKGISGDGKTIFADAHVTHRGKKIGRIEGRVLDADGSMVAVAHQVFYIKQGEHGTKAAQDI